MAPKFSKQLTLEGAKINVVPSDTTGKVKWEAAFKLFLESDDKTTCIQFIDGMTDDEIERVMQYMPSDNELHKEFRTFMLSICEDIEAETGAIALNDVPFAGTVTGGPPLNAIPGKWNASPPIDAPPGNWIPRALLTLVLELFPGSGTSLHTWSSFDV